MNEDMPWVNLTQEEVDELRNKKHELTEYGKQKLKQLTHEEMLEIAAEREAANKPTRNERIDLAVKELGYMLMGGQDMREYAGSVAFIMDVLESLKDKEDEEFKDSADFVA